MLGSARDVQPRDGGLIEMRLDGRLVRYLAGFRIRVVRDDVMRWILLSCWRESVDAR